MGIFTRFSLKNVSAILVLCLLIVFGGIYSSVTLKKETMPDISIPVVCVITVYPGASPGDVQEKITKPLENMVSSVNGIKSLDSTSSENFSSIVAQFDYSANMDDMQRKVESAIKDVKLPDNVAAPKIMRIDMNSMPVLSVSVSNDKLSHEDLEQKVHDDILPSLTGIEGVGQVQLASESQKAVYIKLLPDKLKQYNLTSQTVSQLLQANNVSFPAGSLSLNDTVEPIRITGKFNSLDELKNIKLPVIPNTQAIMSSTFTQMGQGIAELGKAVGQIGQGMAGMNQAFNGQIQLLSAIQETQSKLVASQFALNEAKQVMANPNATAAQKQIATATIQQMTPVVKVTEAAIEQMKKQLKDIQSKMSQQSGATVNANTGDKAQSAGMADSGATKQTGINMTLQQISLSDIAEVNVDTDKTTTYSRTNGNPSVILQVVKTQESNTVDVSDAVKDKLDTLKDMLPGGTNVSIILDQADYVNESISGMLREGVTGAIFAFLVILLFLRNFRTTIIACISIPLSVLITLIALKQFNVTLNILTLGGLSVAIGRIVDDSIVVIENIYRRLQSDEIRSVDLIKHATKEVASAITSSTLTTVSVFLPVAFVGGIAGVMFKPFALTLAVAMGSSLLVAITVIPVMSKLMLLKSKRIKHSDFHEGKLMKGYAGLLNWSLEHKAITLLVAFVLFAGSLCLLPFIGTSFIQEQKDQYVSIKMDYPAGTDVKIVNDKALEIEKILAGIKDIEKYQTTIGSSTTSFMSAMSNQGSGSIMAQLDKDSNVDKVIKELKGKISDSTGKGQFTIEQSSSSGGGMGSINNIEVHVIGVSADKIKEAAELLTKEISSIKGLERVTNNLTESKPEISISVDQKKASEKGLSAAQVGMTVSGFLNNSKVTTMVVDNKSMDVLMGVKLDTVSKIDDIKAIELTAQTGGTVKISDIAEVKEVPGPVGIFSLNGKEYAKITGKIAQKDTGAVSKSVQQKIKELKLPEGVEIKMGGITEMMDDTFVQMGLAMVVAVFLVFLVMMVALGTARAPFAILFSLPLAAIGGLVALFITGLPLDMPSMIGGLMLIGIVVTNAIVLIDRVKQKRNEDMPVREALLEAGRVRMRPILMTAIATIAALIPLALGFSKGSTMSQSLAVIVIGGLTTSTFLTLVVVPVIYEGLENLSNRIFKKNEEF
ncbi:efflux RND transporter permease subunit [Pseudobacteroides cellulosolvens]|uniref:Acriflavin resistance protein n=1 Tax=Pseudobacteroides cellulosolvens ATCC 35603 = DSM 2933 TaxID=398512 RepID=A0A0L6JJR2_9FIRM|nr:efflux RND transporter permease subunit [Pseudobacteroides cellulosolvens]KNY25980.1 acriflavin resistance protein [Pseudobacteroides cellulosolvens ATCC 35603 = DSM 2933]